MCDLDENTNDYMCFLLLMLSHPDKKIKIKFISPLVKRNQNSRSYITPQTFIRLSHPHFKCLLPP